MVNTRGKIKPGGPKKISQANGVAENAIAEVDNGDGDLNIYSDDEAGLEQNASEDDEATDQMWEDDEEYEEEEEEEEYIADEDAVNNEDDIKENGGADEDNDEDAIIEKDDDEVGAKGKHKCEVEVSRDKKIKYGGEAKEKEHGREAKPKEAMARDGKKAKGHDSGKVEAGLKNDKNSNKMIKKKAIDVGPKKVNSKDKQESSQKGNEKGKKRVESMGMIFICSSKTKSDCFKYMVLGLPESKKNIVEKIYSGMRLFLYDVDLKLMYGIFKAAGPGGYNIEPKAFKSQFPSQVRFSVMDDCLPIPEEKFKEVIKENYYSKSKFDCQLKEEQVKKLCKLFIRSRKRNLPKKLRGTLKAHRAENSKHLAPESSRRRITTDRKRPALEEPRFRDRPRKRPRKLTPPRRPLPAPVPSYTSDRRDQYSYRDRRESSPVSREPYRDRREREPPLVIRRDPYLESVYLPEPYSRNLPEPYSRNLPEPYSKNLPEPYTRNLPEHYSKNLPEPYTVNANRSGYGDGRGLYLEHPAYSVAYSGGYARDPVLVDSRDGCRENRRVGYRREEGYTRDPVLVDSRDGYRENRGVEYRREEVLDRGGVYPLSVETRYRGDEYSQLVPVYADPIYSGEYGSRVGLGREYRI